MRDIAYYAVAALAGLMFACMLWSAFRLGQADAVKNYRKMDWSRHLKATTLSYRIAIVLFVLAFGGFTWLAHVL